MRKAVLLAGALMLCVPSVSFADRAYDFSDLESFRLELPFNVLDVQTTGTGMERKQVYRLSDSYDAVVKKLATMHDKQETVGQFYVLGLTQQTVETAYQLMLGYKNEHHYAQIRPDGSGCSITFEIRPISYVSGVYDPALYGFHMPDGGGVMAVIYTKE